MTYHLEPDPYPDVDWRDLPWRCPDCGILVSGRHCPDCYEDSPPAVAAPEDERRPLSDSSPVPLLEETNPC